MNGGKLGQEPLGCWSVKMNLLSFEVEASIIKLSVPYSGLCEPPTPYLYRVWKGYLHSCTGCRIHLSSVQVMLQDKTGSLRLNEDYGRDDMAKVNVLEDCLIELSKVFPEAE